MSCECGCGYEGEDPVAQYLLEEACMTALEQFETAINLAAAEEREREHALSAAQAAVAQAVAEAEQRAR